MNLFQKYGIKEVADVVFYSINAIGDEEFYTPVLFLDTLKVSTLEKTAEKVEAKGGKGNKKLITWNFGKEITLNLEDALFSPASMSMIWGGRLNSKLSDYTSAIVKSNVANKYGDLNYSIKAYPSPALTDNEWEIIFEKAENLGLFGKDFGDTSLNDKYSRKYVLSGDSDKDMYIKENRQYLIDQYFVRNREQENYLTEDDALPYLDENFTVKLKETDENNYNGRDYKTLLFTNNGNFQNSYKRANSSFTFEPQFLIPYGIPDYTTKPDANGYISTVKELGNFNLQQLIENSTKKTDYYECPIYFQYCYKAQTSSGYLGTGANDIGSTISIENSSDSSGFFSEIIMLKIRYRLSEDGQRMILDDKIKSFFRRRDSKDYLPDSNHDTFWIGQAPAGYRVGYRSNDDISSNLDSDAGWFTFKYCSDQLKLIKNLFPNLLDTIEYEKKKAMPEKLIRGLMDEISSLNKLGKIETDFNDIEVIDRMEKCIVKNREGLTISTEKQKENLFRYYSNDSSSSYTIYYDAKTMLPLFHIEDGIINTFDGDNFTIKLGTVYYKWTRTVKYKNANSDGILGKTLVIDAETFPDDYKIVGETYIRNQKTGKDQRYQFTIYRANVSSDTSVTLEAEGDPTTFSMQIDVLTPPNDIMMELKQYDVEEDILEGGTRIVPQKSTYSYTPTNVEYAEEVSEKNEEIY